MWLLLDDIQLMLTHRFVSLHEGGGYGPSKGVSTIDAGVALEQDTGSTFTELPGYTGGYVKFHYTGGWTPIAWDYITFKDWVLKGGTNKIMKVDAWYIYIIGTNARGSMPTVGTTFEVFSSIWTTLLLGPLPEYLWQY
jgi:hypothetical protein